MLKFIKGDLFESPAEAWVNAVNTVGVMGKGIALEFKHRFPEMFAAYKEECANGRLRPGKLHVFEQNVQPRYIINFPTKVDWKQPSKLPWIEAGLARLFGKTVSDLHLSSIAIPALGSKNGFLSWTDVKACIEKWYWIFDDVVGNCDIAVYEPLEMP